MGGSKAASGFGEGSDAPLVLLDSAAKNATAASEAIVLSPFDMFGHQRSQKTLGPKGTVGWGPDLSLAPAAKSLPKGYNSSCALFGGTGGVNHVMHEWGQAMQTAYGTKRKTGTAQDSLTAKVGYWTDNVAFCEQPLKPDFSRPLCRVGTAVADLSCSLTVYLLCCAVLCCVAVTVDDWYNYPDIGSNGAISIYF